MSKQVKVTLNWGAWCDVAGWLGADHRGAEHIVECAKRIVDERDHYRSRVLATPEDADGITMAQALAVAKRRGWTVCGDMGSVAISSGGTTKHTDFSETVAAGIARFANAVAERAEDACSLDIIDEMRAEGE